MEMRRKTFARPDVIEPAAAVRSLPIKRAVAPPGINPFFRRLEMAHGVDPRPCRAYAAEFFNLHWRMAHDPEKSLMIPYVRVERRDVEIARDDCITSGSLFGDRPFGHFVEKSELMREFWIDRAVGLVASRGHIEIMQNNAPSRCARRKEGDRDMAGVPVAAKGAGVDGSERNLGGDRDPVVALLAVDRDVRIAKLMEDGERKFAVPAFRFLKAEDIWRLFAQQAHGKINSQPYRIDVPAGDSELHAASGPRPLSMPDPARQALRACRSQFFGAGAASEPAVAGNSRDPRRAARQHANKRHPNKKGHLSPGAPRSETVTGRGPANANQAERGDAPGQSRRSHAFKIIRACALSSHGVVKAECELPR